MTNAKNHAVWQSTCILDLNCLASGEVISGLAHFSEDKPATI